MFCGNNLNHKTHYDVLGVKEDASYEEIRSSYRSAILDSHPDKLQKGSKTSNSHHESGDRFIEIQKAWEILSNQRSRAVYDTELRVLQQDAVAADDVSLEDLMVEDADEVLELFYQCRCGDYFSIDTSELEKMGYSLLRDGSKISLQKSDALPASIVLPCGSCSLKFSTLLAKWINLAYYMLCAAKPFMSDNTNNSWLEREMGSGEGSSCWSVVDGVKIIPTTPEALMAEINSAISAFEYAHATALLKSSPSSLLKNKRSDVNSTSPYDARMADEAYKEGLAALAAGKLDEALHSLNISLSKCPPDKTSAVAKLQSLISLTSQQLQKSMK